MARYECGRCNEVCFTTNPEHICKDIRKRLARREKQVNAVVGVLDDKMSYYPNGDTKLRESVAREIVMILANMGVEDD